MSVIFWVKTPKGRPNAKTALFCEVLRALWLSPEFIGRTWREMRGIIRTEQERPQMLF